MKKFPNQVFVNLEESTDGPWLNTSFTLEGTDEGKVGVYRLEEIIDRRDAVEVRRSGTKKWFKP